ncbi:N-acetylglucosamine-1-phosphodiester alpha-N-acetylglucosaminidase [Callorhinchus milii]|uniref:N-acetylglucosamine-1-phosphodiester alpha-N-acetylglucosaminidase n=1 Tax=Callorhinchus milii TaxID=7868 RepID=UPI001C3FF024|nr:N-acetylglucosamine-1-phosphodiester alpha-N-acetylglucosaminidase [Callorhinchus milii]
MAVGGGPRSPRGGPALLLALSLISSHAAAGGTSLYDLLLPYHPSEHGSHHNHRYVRDCQPVTYGNVTHETWPADKSTDLPIVSTTVFVSKFPTDEGKPKAVYGHFTVVSNPLRTVSVLEPLKPGGCSRFYTATVQETDNLKKCLVAQNGGFFQMNTGRCLGNIVSNGNLVQNGKGIQNAQFGIKKDGTLVFGYLSEEDVLDTGNPFVQLVSGVVWLLRNGTIYINESKMAECAETQETGSFDKFVNVVSARTAVGHDKYGRLVLFHIDGQTDDRGLNLWEMAEFLKHRGVVNAINLDGGGSATLVLNGTLANYPSDHCSFDSMWRCPRQVSTVMCVHEPECVPADCSGHGNCLLGDCFCTDFWSGPACDTLDCGPSNCTENGICTENGCVCFPGWMGVNCSYECPVGWYGQQCQQACQCADMCPCHPVTGSCNITLESILNGSWYRVHNCIASQMDKTGKEQQNLEEDSNFLKTKIWPIISVTLLLMFLMSAAGNIFQFCQNGTCSEIRRGYSYHLLKDANGILTHAEMPEIIPLKQTNTHIQEDNSQETMNF